MSLLPLRLSEVSLEQLINQKINLPMMATCFARGASSVLSAPASGSRQTTRDKRIILIDSTVSE